MTEETNNPNEGKEWALLQCPNCGVDEKGQDIHEQEIVDDDCLIEQRCVKWLCKGCYCEYETWGHTTWEGCEISKPGVLLEDIKAFADLMDRFEWIALSVADCRKDMLDWLAPDEIVTVEVLQKHIFYSMEQIPAGAAFEKIEGEEEAKLVDQYTEKKVPIAPEMWYPGEGHPPGCVHLADYISCWASVTKERGLFDYFHDWKHDSKEEIEMHLFHYLAMTSMGTENDPDVYDDEDIDLAKRAAPMIRRAYERNGWGKPNLGTWEAL